MKIEKKTDLNKKKNKVIWPERAGPYWTNKVGLYETHYKTS